MKTIKEKFKSKVQFVKPLYRKINTNKITPIKRNFVTINIDSKKLRGDAFDVIKVSENKRIYPKNLKKYNVVSKGCKSLVSTGYVVKNAEEISCKEVPKMIGIAASEFTLKNEISQNNKTVIVHMVPDSWLRMYPAPSNPNERILSIVFRCCVCQLGLATFLVLWTLIWMIVIHHFEGPFETKVSIDFQEQQNKLIVDLATELRQITPISPKWRAAIARRIGDERQLTIAAVGKGARLHPGHFWDVAGTFLFTIYVMTALGFGAPVPQTIWGRTATLIYAAIAVPIQLYLMVNLSTCMVASAEGYMGRLNTFFEQRVAFEDRQNTLVNTTGSNSRISELIKFNTGCLRRRILCVLSWFCVGRCVPLATVLYYLLGVAVFGLARGKEPIVVVMFPLEFTTSGGLEHVECYVRIMYGLYVEGAMILLACALATLRRHSSGPMSKMAERYQLFSSEKCAECL